MPAYSFELSEELGNDHHTEQLGMSDCGEVICADDPGAVAVARAIATSYYRNRISPQHKYGVIAYKDGNKIAKCYSGATKYYEAYKEEIK